MKNSTLFSACEKEQVVAKGGFLSCTERARAGLLPVPPAWKDGVWALPLAPCASFQCAWVPSEKDQTWRVIRRKESGILEMKPLQFSHVLNFWTVSWQCSTPHSQGSWQGPLSTFSVSDCSVSNAPLHPTPGWDPPLSQFHNKPKYSQGCPPGCFISHPELKQIHSSGKAMNKFAAELHTLNHNKSFLRSYYY